MLFKWVNKNNSLVTTIQKRMVLFIDGSNTWSQLETLAFLLYFFKEASKYLHKLSLFSIILEWRRYQPLVTSLRLRLNPQELLPPTYDAVLSHSLFFFFLFHSLKPLVVSIWFSEMQDDRVCSVTRPNRWLVSSSLFWLAFKVLILLSLCGYIYESLRWWIVNGV